LHILEPSGVGEEGHRGLGLLQRLQHLHCCL
jgi:hypothetical protein